ncbi:hypothetical protein J19TS2_19990 [Cohnella xylanilytica]|uniref:Uncharacterized protein n=1 Tax=Cohnella xylanilytica TaxID=557555 RepID=A0A841TZJ9_9BACL|nr:hypothetical protein [Cohnella xylanilytica]MBB6691331.1 hypothetical protein [Cohnella xylanilytica]GIO12444.1 hypothetical protein J19TS2_19990 [Cohnella xylanilytica]
MRQSAKEAKVQRAMREGAPIERREALARQAGSEFADELGHEARAGGGYGRRHPPMTRG